MRQNNIINNPENTQIVCINIDDSGKLVNNEKVTIYAGLVFTSKPAKDKFITQYRSIVQNMRCKYCHKDKNHCTANKSCPELKHNMLKPKHNRQLMNYVKKYSILCCIINNEKIYPNIKQDKASRGRYLDFALKLLVKQTINGLIMDRLLDPNKSVRLILNIDEQTTKTNGYYNLKDGIIEELKYGICNFNYNAMYPPILNSNLDVRLYYQKSEKSFLIQASDLIAGTIRQSFLSNINDLNEFSKKVDFVNYKLFLP